jgi:hypothetical protein
MIALVTLRRSKMMRNAIQSGLFVTVLALPSLAFAATAAELDSNGDGLVTIDEMQAVYPDLAVETFTAMDLNADGALDAEEMAAAQEAGVIPATDG